MQRVVRFNGQENEENWLFAYLRVAEFQKRSKSIYAFGDNHHFI